ncbi:MAG: hypothetical protein IT378_18605 [Sandaracinaceae bacterium]|nr:hypothetical protein [Sandaracinaceae bacterium]
MSDDGEAFFRIERRGRVVLLTRTARPFDTIADVEREYGAVVAALGRVPKARGSLVVDLRDAPPRNDPAFEDAVARLRKRIFEGFARTAVVVRTASGKLQVQRHAKDDHHAVEVFTSLEEALTALG